MNIDRTAVCTGHGAGMPPCERHHPDGYNDVAWRRQTTGESYAVTRTRHVAKRPSLTLYELQCRTAIADQAYRKRQAKHALAQPVPAPKVFALRHR